MNGYFVSIENFEGPLDLLLHLVKEKKMELESLELSVITAQYLDYIQHYQDLNLDIASEYLVMASYLVELKSRMLIPKEVVKVEDEYEEDPRERLIKRLVEYKKYKDVTSKLLACKDERYLINLKTESSLEEFKNADISSLPIKADIYDLMKAMQKMYHRKSLSSPITTNITKKEVSIDECLDDIRGRMKKFQRISFEELFEEVDVHHFVVHFLAILVLCNKNEIRISQDELFDSIVLEVI